GAQPARRATLRQRTTDVPWPPRTGPAGIYRRLPFQSMSLNDSESTWPRSQTAPGGARQSCSTPPEDSRPAVFCPRSEPTPARSVYKVRQRVPVSRDRNLIQAFPISSALFFDGLKDADRGDDRGVAAWAAAQLRQDGTEAGHRRARLSGHLRVDREAPLL